MLGISEHEYSEVIATSLLPSSRKLLTALGVFRAKSKYIGFRIYPGTRLAKAAEELVFLCLVQPRTPLPFYYAVLNKLEIRPPLEPARAIPGQCVAEYTIRLEVVVKTRYRRNDGIMYIISEPVDIEVRHPITYVRAYGCSIEQLIALTRIRYYSRLSKQRPQDRCHILNTLYMRIMQMLDCILHSTRDPIIHKYAVEAAKEADQLVALAGGVPPTL